MGKIIIWKDQPLARLREISNYLEDEFSLAVAKKFLEKVASKADRLADYPDSGQATRYKTVRRFRIDKYHSLFYRAHGRKIFILFLWDGRQDPRKNPYR